MRPDRTATIGDAMMAFEHLNEFADRIIGAMKGGEKLLTLIEASDLCQVDRQTMYRWCVTRKGPKFIAMGETKCKRSRIRIRVSDFNAWLESRVDKWDQPSEVSLKVVDL